jgi:site-specific DNA-methyltransferase (adenine-specific)
MSLEVLTGRWQDVLPEGLRVDHVITDPPYSEHVHSKARAGARKVPLRDGNGRLTRCAISREKDFGFECIAQTEIEAVADMVEERAKRWFLAFSDVESAWTWRGAFTAWEYVRTCFWHRPNGSPQFTGDRPGSHIEAITVMHRKGKKRWNGGGKGNLYTCNVVNQQALKRDNNTREHPTQKPLDLMLALVADFTDPNDLILDPYCGSGTTGVACLRLGRSFVGCEMNPTYAEIARERLRAEESNSTLQARQSGQLPMFGGGK